MKKIVKLIWYVIELVIWLILLYLCKTPPTYKDRILTLLLILTCNWSGFVLCHWIFVILPNIKEKVLKRKRRKICAEKRE